MAPRCIFGIRAFSIDLEVWEHYTTRDCPFQSYKSHWCWAASGWNLAWNGKVVWTDARTAEGNIKHIKQRQKHLLTGIGVNRSIIPQTLDRRENGLQHLRILYSKVIYNHEKNAQAKFNKLNSELQCLPSQEDKKFSASRAQALIQPQGVQPGIRNHGPWWGILEHLQRHTKQTWTHEIEMSMNENAKQSLAIRYQHPRSRRHHFLLCQFKCQKGDSFTW